MAHRNGLNGGIEQRIKHLIDFCTGNAEHMLNALRFQLCHHQIGAVLPNFAFRILHGFRLRLAFNRADSRVEIVRVQVGAQKIVIARQIDH